MDVLTKKQRSYCMSRIRSRDTSPEIIVRRYLHSHGVRYTLHKSDIAGKPDIFVKKYNLAIFVHGCFWHQHPKCKYAVVPKTRQGFWREKLQKNVRRDQTILNKLKKIGCRTMVLWECQLTKRDQESVQRFLEKKLSKIIV